LNEKKFRIQGRFPGNGMNGLGRYGSIYGLPRNGGNHQNWNECSGLAWCNEGKYGLLLFHL